MHQVQLNVASKLGHATNLKNKLDHNFGQNLRAQMSVHRGSHKLNTYRPHSRCQTKTNLYGLGNDLELPKIVATVASSMQFCVFV